MDSVKPETTILTLQAGDNVIKISTVNGDGPNLDQIELKRKRNRNNIFKTHPQLHYQIF